MGTRQRFAIPDGWVARGFRFEVEPTSAEQPGRIAQAFGSRRFAYNWALAQVKANLDARTTDPAVPLLAWNFYELRRAWNQAKDAVAPWWRCSSKEAYASGIADLVVALHNWSDSKAGRRAGGRVGFPRFKARHRDHGRVRFTTGAMRLEPDRRHLVVPVIGRLRSKENTRRLQRLAAKDRARVLSMTLSEQGGRLFVAVQAIVCQQPQPPANPRPAAASTLASATNGPSSPTTTTRSSASPIPPPGWRPTPSVAGSPGNDPAALSAPEGTARRTPS
jgi:putative transposase